MPNPKFRADYDALAQIAKRNGQEADATQHMLDNLRGAMRVLESGDWVGQGAKAFYAEMNNDVLPSLQRLVRALQSAQRVTLQLSREIKTAEDEAAALLNGKDVPIAEKKSDGGGLLGFVGDLFSGAGSELLDMGKGLLKMVSDPIGTAKGLAYAVTHPGELWDALTKPFVEDWNNGHPGRAIGRGIIFVGSFLVGTHGADKVAKGASAAGKAAELSEAAAKAGKAAELSEAAAKAGKAAEISETAGKAGKVAEAGEATSEVGKAAKASDAAEGAAKASTLSREERIAQLAQDPAHVGVTDAKFVREAEVGLQMEERGLLKPPITRDPTGAAEFIDGAGGKWDVKAFNSNFPPKKGGFTVERSMKSIQKEISLGENVIVDTANMTPAHISELREAVEAAKLSEKVLWFS